MGVIIKDGIIYSGGSSGSSQQADFTETDTTSPAYIKHKPTTLSAFTNDAGFITNTVNNLTNYYTKTESYTKTEVDSMISAAKSGRFIYVATLPTTDIHTDAIYLVPKTVSQEDNIKDEYINLDGTTTGWEKIGDTQIDLSNYVQKSQTAGLIKNDGTIDTNTYLTSVPTATSSALGLVKPDNSTITVDANGVISATEVNNDSLKSTKARIIPQTNSIVKKTWVNFSSSGAHTWTDGENIYYSEGLLSNSGTQRVLDKATSTWINKTWNGVAELLYGAHIWTDGDNIYHSYGSRQYVLDKSTSTWSTKTWNGLTEFPGEKVWTDGNDIYYSNGSNQYVLNKATSTWSAKSWTGLTSFIGNYVWTDGDNIYYSNSSAQYVLDKSTSTWSAKVWSGLSDNILGTRIWTDGNNTYYSYNGSNYALNKSTSTWSTKAWSGYSSIDGQQVWTDGDNIYYSYGTSQYQIYTPKTTNLFIDNATLVTKQSTTGLIKNDGTIDANEYIPKSATEGLVMNDGSIDTSKHVHLQPTHIEEFQAKTWTGLTDFDGNNIWTDGENIYYSHGTARYGDQYILNKSTSTWSVKTWSGIDMLVGSNIWTDGDNIYYSSGSTQYVLNKSTSTWNTKTWNGLTSFDGNCIWNDGENTYYSNYSLGGHYVLDKSTSTWSAKTWSGLTIFYGWSIWTDGENIYYSDASTQYVLNKSTSTWNTKTWSGLTSFNGSGIWTDGENIYYSYNGSNYVLDKSTSTWSAKTWSGYSSINGSYIWTDGENTYYSNGTTQYVFISESIYEDGFVKSNGTIDTNEYAKKSEVAFITKTRYTITDTNWSNSPDADGYYTYTITLNPTLSLTWPPTTDIAGVNDNTFSTDAEKEAYDLLDECNLTTTSTLILYAKTKPETTFYIWVEGEVAS